VTPKASVCISGNTAQTARTFIVILIVASAQQNAALETLKYVR
jgi:hypothetical protein